MSVKLKNGDLNNNELAQALGALYGLTKLPVLQAWDVSEMRAAIVAQAKKYRDAQQALQKKYITEDVAKAAAPGTLILDLLPSDDDKKAFMDESMELDGKEFDTTIDPLPLSTDGLSPRQLDALRHVGLITRPTK